MDLYLKDFNDVGESTTKKDNKDKKDKNDQKESKFLNNL